MENDLEEIKKELKVIFGLISCCPEVIAGHPGVATMLYELKNGIARELHNVKLIELLLSKVILKENGFASDHIMISGGESWPEDADVVTE